MATFAAAAISTTPNTTLTRPTGAKPTARPPRAAPMREPADMAETIRFGPSPVSIAPTAGGDCGSAIKQPRAQQRSGLDTLRNKGLFLLDGGLRGIVQRALNYLRGRKAA